MIRRGGRREPAAVSIDKDNYATGGGFDGYVRDGSHYDGSCEIWKCTRCKTRVHVGRLQNVMDTHECVES